jgi:hypothetical protein
MTPQSLLWLLPHNHFRTLHFQLPGGFLRPHGCLREHAALHWIPNEAKRPAICGSADGTSIGMGVVDGSLMSVEPVGFWVAEH